MGPNEDLNVSSRTITNDHERTFNAVRPTRHVVFSTFLVIAFSRKAALLRFVLRDLARCKVQLSKPRIEPWITSQLQVEPDLQMAGVGHLGCSARARDGAWMTKLARTRVHARKGGQSWYLAMYEDGQAPRVMICTVSTLRLAYLHTAEHSVTAHVCGSR